MAVTVVAVLLYLCAKQVIKESVNLKSCANVGFAILRLNALVVGLAVIFLILIECLVVKEEVLCTPELIVLILLCGFLSLSLSLVVCFLGDSIVILVVCVVDELLSLKLIEHYCISIICKSLGNNVDLNNGLNEGLSLSLDLCINAVDISSLGYCNHISVEVAVILSVDRLSVLRGAGLIVVELILVLVVEVILCFLNKSVGIAVYLNAILDKLPNRCCHSINYCLVVLRLKVLVNVVLIFLHDLSLDGLLALLRCYDLGNLLVNRLVCCNCIVICGLCILGSLLLSFGCALLIGDCLCVLVLLKKLCNLNVAYDVALLIGVELNKLLNKRLYGLVTVLILLALEYVKRGSGYLRTKDFSDNRGCVNLGYVVVINGIYVVGKLRILGNLYLKGVCTKTVGSKLLICGVGSVLEGNKLVTLVLNRKENLYGRVLIVNTVYGSVELGLLICSDLDSLTDICNSAFLKKLCNYGV